MERNNGIPVIGVSRHRLGTDGNGVTTLVAFHGCNLRCKYCLNPEVLGSAEGLRRYTPESLYEEVKVDDLYFHSTGGGITFGGVEPCLQDAAELKVSTFLLDLAVSNVKGKISRDEVSQRLRERYGDNLYEEPKTGLDGGYEIIPPDSPEIDEIEEYNRKLRPALYAKLDKNRNRKNLK